MTRNSSVVFFFSWNVGVCGVRKNSITRTKKRRKTKHLFIDRRINILNGNVMYLLNSKERKNGDKKKHSIKTTHCLFAYAWERTLSAARGKSFPQTHNICFHLFFILLCCLHQNWIGCVSHQIIYSIIVGIFIRFVQCSNYFSY